MITAKECLDDARRCAGIAGQTTDPAVKTELTKMARQWVAAAEEESRLIGRDVEERPRT